MNFTVSLPKGMGNVVMIIVVNLLPFLGWCCWYNYWSKKGRVAYHQR
jgi:hypothetical protein